MPGNLTDMKRSPKEQKADAPEIGTAEQEDYSYGLRVDLRDEEIEKLGLSLPEVGSPMVLVANVKVISVRESADENGKDKNIELQIVEMELEPYKSNDTDHVKKLYSE